MNLLLFLMNKAAVICDG